MENVKKYIKKENKDNEIKIIKLLNKHTLNILEKISEKYNIDISELKSEYIIEIQKPKSKRKTGYNIFMSTTAINEEIKKENPKLNNRELLIRKSRMWGGLSQEEKDFYNLLAKSRN